MYKNKKENSKAIATPGLNNNENNNNNSNPGIMNDDLYHNKMLPTPIELVIPNQGQELAPNYNNQQGATRELGNNSVDNETVQNIRQEMVHNISQDPARNLSSFNIDEDIINQMKQDILLDIKQELKQNIRSKVMTSFYKDNNIDDNSGSNSNVNK
ncbi:unnamed protein product [Rhizophagus irregularis]|nr:unnamed protein product [Rhizophagus irregularis]